MGLSTLIVPIPSYRSDGCAQSQPRGTVSGLVVYDVGGRVEALISLTRTKKKGLESKQKLVEEIRSCIDKYARMCVFTVRNMRNNKFKDIRVEWQHSRFFLGKNKVMALALGRTPEEEVADNLHQVSSRLVGHCGILLTNATKEEMLEYFDNVDSPDYARSGDIAMETVHLNEGPLTQFAHSIEPQLRKLGLPTQLIRGVPTLLKDHTVCKKGDILKPEQAHILKLFGNQMAAFRMTVELIWTRHDGSIEDLDRGTLTASQDFMVSDGGALQIDSNGEEIEEELEEGIEEDEDE